ncbi:MAG: hypothetical protein WCJ56_11560, partial [bacterium]
MPYSWEWSRSPSVPPEYSHGCTVIACSEWNLDAEPQPYLTTAEVNRTLLDEGRPVWRTASFHFNGSQSRFLRDAIFLTGRGMTPFYATPESATWSHKGADQSTYAAKDRLDTVTQFLTTYEGLFDTLQPVREVAYYVHPGWGDPNSQNMVAGLPAALMTGYQVHAISHADLQSGGLSKYKILLAPGLTGPFNYPFELAAFKDFTAKGGSIVGTVTGTRYYAEFQDPTKFGIKVEDQPVLNKDGTPSIDKNTGKPVTKRVFVETLEQRAQLAGATVWGDIPRTSVLPLDLGDQWAYKDAEGKKVGYSSRAHWTGYQLWANAKAPAVESAPTLKAAFDKVSEPLVIKDQPQVFVCAERPRDAKAQGLFLFVSNYTIPDDPRWTAPRVPYFFWPTYAKPNVTTIKVKEEGIGAIYDLMTGRAVPFTREGGRVIFTANLGTIEGRVFACYPAPISGASLTLPASAIPGSKLVGTFRLLAAGTPVPYQASVWIKVQDADGLVLRNIYRSLPADGTLPEIDIPADARGPLSVTVTDTVSGRMAQASVAIAAPALTVATEANPITIYRGDAIHRILTDKAPIRIMVTEGKDDFGTRDGKPYREIKPENINAGVANERRWAEMLRLALQNAGIKVEVVSSNAAVVSPLFAHPWEGNGAWVRESGTVPNRRVEGPVIVIGSVKTNTYLQDLERSCVAPRAFGQANTGAGRAVIAYLPRAFSPEADSIAVVGDDDAGMAEAARQLAKLVATDPGPDSYYTAREHIRYQWLPADVARFKTQQGIPDPGGAPGTATANAAPAVPAKDNGWEGVENRLGPHIFTLDASANGVAVGLSSLAKPLALVSTEGKPIFFAGGNADVMPRDVAVSADGKTAIAGYSLSGKVIAYTADGKPSWEEKAAIFTKPDPLNWDTYKDSERFLTVSPDHTMVIAAAGTKGFVAREANTGKVLWILAADQDPGWPNGIQSSQISWSPDGRYALLYSDSVNAAKELTIQDVLVDVTTGQRVWTGPRDASDWELYSTVGAQGAWTITAGRGTTFAFRDDKGAVLRIFKAEQLPAELA